MPRRAVAQQVYRRRPRPAASGATRFRRAPAAAGTFSATVTNSGTVETAPTITIAGPVTAASVYFENVTQGKTVWVNTSVPSGQTLTVNFKTRSITLNGVSLSASVDSRWWTLSPGANTVRSNVAASVAHRNAYSN